jgi:hypothetical protein
MDQLRRGGQHAKILVQLQMLTTRMLGQQPAIHSLVHFHLRSGSVIRHTAILTPLQPVNTNDLIPWHLLRLLETSSYPDGRCTPKRHRQPMLIGRDHRGSKAELIAPSHCMSHTTCSLLWRRVKTRFGPDSLSLSSLCWKGLYRTVCCLRGWWVGLDGVGVTNGGR